MNLRLNTIASLAAHSADKGIIDVGTDHGYIPVSFALNGFTGKIIASDINEMPLDSAKRTALDAGVSDKIDFRLGNGLECCSADEVDTVIIAGLGGDMIASIIDCAEWTMSPSVSLILQPMTKAEIIRYYLTNNGYSILSENPVFENGKLFHIFSVRFSDKNTYLSDAELFTGKIEQLRTSAHFDDILSAECRKISKAVNGLNSSAPGSVKERFYSDILDSLHHFKDGCYDDCK